MFPSPPPVSSLSSASTPPMLLSVRQGSPRHPPQKTRQSESYRTNRLTSRENANTKRRGGGTMLRGGRLPHPRAGQTWQAKG